MSEWGLHSVAVVYVIVIVRLTSPHLDFKLPNGIKLTESGQKIGTTMMRNSRLLEVMMESALKVKIDEEMVCGIEHHMKKQFTDALCTMLNHPRKCPHDREIPMGECCQK